MISVVLYVSDYLCGCLMSDNRTFMLRIKRLWFAVADDAAASERVYTLARVKKGGGNFVFRELTIDRNWLITLQLCSNL